MLIAVSLFTIHPVTPLPDRDKSPCPSVTEQENSFEDGWPGYGEAVFSTNRHFPIQLPWYVFALTPVTACYFVFLFPG